MALGKKAPVIIIDSPNAKAKTKSHAYSGFKLRYSWILSSDIVIY
jgi:hypothetical protein